MCRGDRPAPDETGRHNKVAYNERESEMPHDIEQFADGTAAFFTNRQVAWHALGTVTDGALTAEDALRMAQLDWTVYKSEAGVQAVTEHGTVMCNDKYMTYRDHPKLGVQGLGVVGQTYTVIQNSEAFDFLNALSDESGAVFETAGSLGGGRRVFMSMRMPDAISLAGGSDKVDMYLMVTTSHNGTKAFTAAITPVRPVCSNTVALALKSAKSTWNLKHTTHVKGKVQQAREALGMVFEYASEFEQEMNALVEAEFTQKEFAKLVEALVREPKDATDRQMNKVEQQRAEIGALWNAPTQANVAGTKWAAFNAVVEWVDWAQPVRSTKGRESDVVRAQRIFDGKGAGLKQRAFALLSK